MGLSRIGKVEGFLDKVIGTHGDGPDGIGTHGPCLQPCDPSTE
jgi:hypothetical protein